MGYRSSTLLTVLTAGLVLAGAVATGTATTFTVTEECLARMSAIGRNPPASQTACS